MYLNKISFLNFRNIHNNSIQFTRRLTVFEGENGQGKTNIVEAITLLSLGKSFRTKENSHLLRHGESFFKVSCDLTKEGVSHCLSFVNQEKKNILINEKKTTALKAFRLMPVILFSPESLSIIKEGPENRRNIIDETLLMEDVDNLKVINDYKKILKTKNRILKQYKKEEISYNKTIDLLHSINEVFYIQASELIKKRINLIKKLEPLLNQNFNQMSNQNVDISVQYVGTQNSQESFENITNTMRNKLQERLPAELAYGSCLVGPHRHDIVFSFNSNDSRYYCSQGQQRALILAFKLTQILYHRHVYGYYPILVLDDVLSELDRGKREFFVNFLSANEAQTFLTTTDLEKTENLKKLDIEIHKVKNGKILNLWS